MKLMSNFEAPACSTFLCTSVQAFQSGFKMHQYTIYNLSVNRLLWSKFLLWILEHKATIKI